MNQTLENLESVYEGNKTQDLDFEFIEASQFAQVIDFKFSQDQNNIVAATTEGYRIYSIENNQMIQENNIRVGQIYNIDFIDNQGSYLIIGLQKSIISWDHGNKCTIKQYKMVSNTIALNFTNPYIVAGLQNNSIIVINHRIQQAYRYFKLVPQLSKDTLFMCNKNQFDTKLCYFSNDATHLIVDCLQQQYLTGIHMKTINVITNEQMVELQKQQQSPPNQTLLSHFLSYTQVFVTVSDDGHLIAISPFVDKQRIYIYQQTACQPLQLLYQLYRGQSKKILSLFFGPNKSIACISYQQGLHPSQNDATLHLYYNLSQQQQDKESLMRIYFKTWSDEKNKLKRTKQTLVKFVTMNGENKIQIFSGNNFYFSETVVMDNQLKQITIQDTQKKIFPL